MEKMDKKPIIGISMGDPFGNGPEITARALADAAVYDRCRPLGWISRWVPNTVSAALAA